MQHKEKNNIVLSYIAVLILLDKQTLWFFAQNAPCLAHAYVKIKAQLPAFKLKINFDKI